MHFADTHFGVENYGRLDPATGLNTRLLDFSRTLNAAIDIALQRDIHLAVFAGDAYKARDPSQTHQREFAKCIRRLTERGVPVVMLTGNHDIPGIRGRAHAMEIYRTLRVADVHILQSPDLLVVQTAAGPVQIAALPYLMKGFLLAREEFAGLTVEQAREAIEQKYRAHISELAERADPHLPTVLMGHFWVREARLSAWQQGYFHASEPQVSVADLAVPAFDYVALGHIHRHQDLNEGAYPAVVYSGSPDCIDFGERNEKKGFVLVELSRGETTWEFVPIRGRREFLEIDVDADNDTPTETVLEAVGRHDLRGSIVRLTYRLSAERLPMVRERELRAALSEAFLIVAIRRDVRRDSRLRERVLHESLDPATALGLFLDQSERGRKRKDDLMGYAELLFEELRREEALR
jgi:DNA repair protein SbcD/Mre11